MAKKQHGNALVEIDERMAEVIELILNGESMSSIQKITGINRKTVSDWKKRDFFKAELDKRSEERKQRIEKRLLAKVDPLMEKLVKIALESPNDKTSLDAIIYALNRLIGTPTNKQIVEQGNGDKEEIKDLQELIESLDNVIPLEK